MSIQPTPLVVVVAGPNGAGKTTSARRLLHGALAVEEFVNADRIAEGLSGLAPSSVALAAGRVMHARLRELASARRTFAFETTLASRSFAPWLRELRQGGFRVHVAFLGLRSPELAAARVAERVRGGGHDVPIDVIKRRFASGLANFFEQYEPMADSWQMLDNSEAGGPRLVAERDASGRVAVYDPVLWERIREMTHEDA